MNNALITAMSPNLNIYRHLTNIYCVNFNIQIKIK